MKKNNQKMLPGKRRKFILLLTIAVVIFITFPCVYLVHRGRDIKRTDIPVYLADNGTDAKLSYLSKDDKAQINNRLSSMESSLFDQMRKDLEAITLYLDDLEESIERNREEIFQVTVNQRENKDGLKQDTDYADQNLSEEVEKLMQQLDQISGNISGTQNDIKLVLTDINNNNTSQTEMILVKFADINTALTNISVSVDTTHNGLKEIMESVKIEGKENHKELLTILEKLNTSFSEENTTNFESLLISLQTQTDTLKIQFASINNNLDNGFRQLTDNVTIVNQGVSDSKTEVTQRLEAMDAVNIEYFTSVKQEIAGSRESVIERIASMESKTDSRFNNLDSSIQSVFQSVSDGKKRLATALLTKNVTNTAGDPCNSSKNSNRSRAGTR